MIKILSGIGLGPTHRWAVGLGLAFVAACGSREPIASDTSEARSVPNWYEEKRVKDMESLKEPTNDGSGTWTRPKVMERRNASGPDLANLEESGLLDRGPGSARTENRRSVAVTQDEGLPELAEFPTQRNEPVVADIAHPEPASQEPAASAPTHPDPQPEEPVTKAEADDPSPAQGTQPSSEGVPSSAAEAPPEDPGEPEPFLDLPFDVPPIPAYRKPGPEDCDWLVKDGVARSTRELPDIKAADHEGYLIGPAYRATMTARQDPSRLGAGRPVVIGVYDDAREGVLGGGWSVHSPRSVFSKDRSGAFEDIAIEIVGLGPTAEVSISWDARWGQPRHIGLFDIGIRGRNDSFIIRANAGVDRLILDGCWWLPCKDYAGTNQRHASGMHIDKWGELIWRNHQWRGARPGTPGINLREHCAYLKSARKGTWIVGNDLRGGNRTGFQIRPELEGNEQPSGPVVIAYNHAKGYGWNNGSDPATFDGGSCITLWSNPNSPTYIFGNRITDAKYGCLAITAQSPDKNWLGKTGFPIGPVYLYGNTFENKRGDRDTAAITAAQEVHVYPNDIAGRLILNDTWGMQRHGIANGAIFLHDPSLLEQNLWTWDTRSKRIRQAGDKLKAQWLVD